LNRPDGSLKPSENSNQINKSRRRFSSSLVTQQWELRQIESNLNPWWLTGFIDAEGCFRISVIKDNRYKTGWSIQLFFKILLHLKDRALLEKIKKYFGVVSVIVYNDNSV